MIDGPSVSRKLREYQHFMRSLLACPVVEALPQIQRSTCAFIASEWPDYDCNYSSTAARHCSFCIPFVRAACFRRQSGQRTRCTSALKIKLRSRKVRQSEDCNTRKSTGAIRLCLSLTSSCAGGSTGYIWNLPSRERIGRLQHAIRGLRNPALCEDSRNGASNSWPPHCARGDLAPH